MAWANRNSEQELWEPKNKEPFLGPHSYSEETWKSGKRRPFVWVMAYLTHVQDITVYHPRGAGRENRFRFRTILDGSGD